MNPHNHGAGPVGGSCCSGKKPDDTVGAVIDPVCGMAVDPASTEHHATHQGKDYHFCSAHCRERFIIEPKKYLPQDRKPVDKEPAAASTGTSCCASKTTEETVSAVVDPVCGMTVDPATTEHHAVHQGTDYHFCSAKCRERFVAEPQK